MKSALNFPIGYLPNAEKNKIFEIFKVVLERMLLELPEDHIMFMKNYFRNAQQMLNSLRVIIYGSPSFESKKLAEALSADSEMLVISRRQFLNLNSNAEHQLNLTTMIGKLKKIIEQEEIAVGGWLFYDMPTSRHEILQFINAGIDPTHVFYIDTCINSPTAWHSYDQFSQYRRKFLQHVLTAKQLYGNYLKVINAGNRNMMEIASECSKLLQYKYGFHVPRYPRILLIAQRGCGRKCLALMLSQKYNLEFIDFELLYRQENLNLNVDHRRDTSHDSELRCAPEIIITILDKKLRDVESQGHGWIVVGLPIDCIILHAICSITTPPNKIIFLEKPGKLCLDNTTQRYQKPFISQQISLSNSFKSDLNEKPTHSVLHPKNLSELAKKHINQLEKNWHAMKKICEHNALTFYLNGDIYTDSTYRGDIFAMIEHAIINWVPSTTVKQSSGQCDEEVGISFSEFEHKHYEGDKVITIKERRDCKLNTKNINTTEDMMSMLSSPLGSMDFAEKPLITNKDTVINLMDLANMEIVGSAHKQTIRKSIPPIDTSKIEVLLSVSTPGSSERTRKNSTIPA